MELTQSLHRNLQQRPDAAAVVDGEVELSWRELVDEVARLAAALRAHGVEPGDRVGILAENSVRVVEHVFACAWAGTVATPVNYRWSVAEMAGQIEEAEVAVLLVGDGFAGAAVALRERCACLTVLVHAGGGSAPAGFADVREWIAGAAPMADARLPADALALLLYTGGTTGEPKGVMLSARSVMTSALGTFASTGLPNRAERCLVISPLFHLAALGNLLGHMMIGSTIVVVPGFDPAAVAELIHRHRITTLTMVPTMIAWMLDHLEEGEEERLRTLRTVSYGAESISPELLRRLRARLPGISLSQRYGMTELGPVATSLRPDDHSDPALLASVGRAAPHAEVRIVDSLDREVPVGEVGEITVRGDNVMLGYWKHPEETARALRGGWMHTGDAGRMDENGYLFLADRLKDMIISGGENVYSAEVEKALAEHPDIAQIAVIGVPDERFGERVHAVVVPREGAHPSLEELRGFGAERLARYKLPRSVQLVERMPLSPVGKILKRELRDTAAEAAGVTVPTATGERGAAEAAASAERGDGG
ncbi:long-chain-fatty-acid--CoA ligase [Brevibacterium salitolerans]|uniref:Long-chain fatty acid--CoA ligase n=1 Tax=Brevibacterium salitolerans TaxID=1403566 RepID=A0ABN2WQI1_9MICO